VARAPSSVFSAFPRVTPGSFLEVDMSKKKGKGKGMGGKKGC
jgi:hypothetical protein